MKSEPLVTQENHPQLAELTRFIGSTRYFKQLAKEVLANILQLGTLLTLDKDQYVIREGDESPAEMYILVEGSLAVVSNNKFILRLDMPGDVIGEIALIQSVPRSADVITETECRLIVFPVEVFEIDPHSPQASIVYVLFSHILAAKLRITTAQSLVRKNQRVAAQGDAVVGIIASKLSDRADVRQAVEASWPEASVIELDDPPAFYEYPAAQRFDLIVADVDYFDDFQRDWNSISNFVQAMQLRGASVLVVGESCHDAANREFLIRKGTDDVLAKPCTAFELNHAIDKIRIWYHKNLELDKAESAAQTDPLTKIANRDRLDEFLDALVTVYPDNRQSFSLVIADVDSFKHYNDTNGHQMGDVVLQGIAALLARNVRRGDLVARYGGEEFVIVLPNCGKHRAVELAESIRLAVESADFPCQDQQPTGNLTLTLGVATFPENGRDLEVLLKRADNCLYEGKRSGKNKVVSAHTQV